MKENKNSEVERAKLGSEVKHKALKVIGDYLSGKDTYARAKFSQSVIRVIERLEREDKRSIKLEAQIKKLNRKEN